MYRLVEYQSLKGKKPFSEWLMSKKIDIKTRSKIEVCLDRMTLGLFGDFKSVGSGVFEIRLHFGPGYRIYYGRQGKEIVLLLCGGAKGTQKKDIAKAKDYLLDFLGRVQK